MIADRLPRGAGVAIALAAASLALASPASAEIYWANEATDNIARANLDGGGATAGFITGAEATRGVAIDGNFVYWSHDGDADPEGNIGRAPLSGTPAAPEFITTTGSPGGVAVDSGAIYWTQASIGKANLIGGSVAQSHVSAGQTGPSACGISSDSDEVYWANAVNPGTLRSAHGSFAVNQSLIPNQPEPCGVARAGNFVYWTNRASNAIGRANFDGSNPDPDFIQLTTTTAPCGVAVDEGHVYWTTRTGASDTIGRSDLGADGNPVGPPDEDFIPAGPAVQDPCGIAVPPTTTPSPVSAAFAQTEVGTQSEIQALYVANTSSSVLDVSTVTLTGAHPGDFEVTGDACTLGAASAGGGCVLNVRFAPTGTGERSALLRVVSNASDSPNEIPLSGTGAMPAEVGAPPPEAPRGDSTAPVFLSASVDPGRFVVDAGGRRERGAGRARKGTTFSYALSEPALVTFTVDRRSKGRLVDGECVKETRANRGRPRCTITKRIGSFEQQSESGANKRRFSGAVGDRTLRPGPHRATLLAVDAFGNVSAPRLLSFRVLRAGD